ncbi:Metallo-dependent phosphatase [Xylariaceae sp. FL0016]|nr:Metallo-dependent phosphatase [Xylariaceae sp. FL0016]
MENTSSRPSNRPSRTRRTRIVCISDTHNCTVKLPAGDVLVHCGDLTNKGSLSELTKQVRWLEKATAAYEAAIIVAGNHDLTLDAPWFEQYGAYHHNNTPQDPAECISLLRQSETLTYLCHEGRTFRLTSPHGPQTTFSVFGSPYSPATAAHGNWAFQYPRHPDVAADAIWDAIPLETDILITHAPPYTHVDETRSRSASGCEALRRALWRTRPRLALCGHVHEARGAGRVCWDLTSTHVRYKEKERVWQWEDPGRDNARISLVDLTAKGGLPLDNDGSRVGDDVNTVTEGEKEPRARPARHGDNTPGRETEGLDPGANPGIGTRGLGGDAASVRCDQTALAGRMGRRETCIVNCAIMANSYPHSGRGPRKMNKPIVVDVELPVWGEEDGIL